MNRAELVKAKGDIATLDISKTREFPEVSSDKTLDKEIEEKVFVHLIFKALKLMNPSNQLDSSFSSLLFLHAVVR